jgi:hypothetical protein
MAVVEGFLVIVRGTAPVPTLVTFEPDATEQHGDYAPVHIVGRRAAVTIEREKRWESEKYGFYWSPCIFDCCIFPAEAGEWSGYLPQHVGHLAFVPHDNCHEGHTRMPAASPRRGG